MPDKPINEIPMFFIMGRPRSGTTLLSTLFDAHHNVRIPPEFPIFLSLIQRFRKVKSWDEQTIIEFVNHIAKNDVFKHRTLENLNVDIEQLTRNLMSLKEGGTLADFLKAFNYSSFSIFPKDEILQIGDKNPLYSIYVNRFVKTCPDARFVCIVRDYRDNFVSMKKLAELELEAPALTLQVTRWRFVVRLFFRWKKKFPEKFFLIRYEDLAEKPEETIIAICQFLGLPFDPTVFDFFHKKEETLKFYPQEIIEKYHSSLLKPISTSRIGLYKSQLTPAQIRLADKVAGSYADRLGYERADTRFQLFLWLQSLPLLIYGTLLFWLMQLGSYLPYRIATTLSVRLLILARTYNRLFGERKKKPW